MSNNKEKTSSLDTYMKEVWEDYRDGFEEDAALTKYLQQTY